MSRHEKPTNGRILAVEAIRELDRRAMTECGIPGVVLMENAAQAVTTVVEAVASKHRIRQVDVICGPGNNGGDGFGTARQLHNLGFDVVVVAEGPQNRFAGDSDVGRQVVMARGTRVPIRFADHGAIEAPREGAVVVDALLGTGIRGEVRPAAARRIRTMNNHEGPIVSVDVPSGLDADTGETLGGAVRAAATVTFVSAKCGFYKRAGPEHVGELHVAPISIPRHLVEEAFARRSED